MIAAALATVGRDSEGEPEGAAIEAVFLGGVRPQRPSHQPASAPRDAEVDGPRHAGCCWPDPAFRCLWDECGTAGEGFMLNRVIKTWLDMSLGDRSNIYL